MQIHTNVTTIKDGKEHLRGVPLSDISTKKPFHEVIWFLLRGSEPTQEESILFSMMLSTCIDHGPGTASGQVTRIVASAKTSMEAAVAAGMLAMGERHGKALVRAAEFFVEHKGNDPEKLVQNMKEKGIRIPGFGHAVLETDERATALCIAAKDLGLAGEIVQFAAGIEQSLQRHSSKSVPLNVDGAMAALLLDLGWSTKQVDGVFMIARVTGLVAQAQEEIANDVGLRRLDEKNITSDM